MALQTTIDYIKKHYPKWDFYFKDRDTDVADADLLDDCIDLALAQINDYVVVEEDSITTTMKLHLLNIVKKMGFDLEHSAEDFDTKPSVIRDYEYTLDVLEKYKTGMQAPATSENSTQVDITAKPRLFTSDGWFTNVWGEDS